MNSTVSIFSAFSRSNRTLFVKARLAHAKSMADFQGMDRLHTKTVGEMAAQKEEARRNAQVADKGKMAQDA